LDVELPSAKLGLNFINAGGSLPTNEIKRYLFLDVATGSIAATCSPLKGIDADSYTMELSIIRAIYFRTSKPPHRSLDETCSTSMFAG